jgi:hypothetical protein
MERVALDGLFHMCIGLTGVLSKLKLSFDIFIGTKIVMDSLVLFLY